MKSNKFVWLKVVVVENTNSHHIFEFISKSMKTIELISMNAPMVRRALIKKIMQISKDKNCLIYYPNHRNGVVVAVTLNHNIAY